MFFVYNDDLFAENPFTKNGQFPFMILIYFNIILLSAVSY